MQMITEFSPFSSVGLQQILDNVQQSWALSHFKDIPLISADNFPAIRVNITCRQCLSPSKIPSMLSMALFLKTCGLDSVIRFSSTST